MPRAALAALVAVALTLNVSPRCQTTWYVDASAVGGNGSSWAQAFASLDAALAACGRGDEIWVAQGRYVPGAATGYALPPDAVLRGGFVGFETRPEEADPTLRRTVLDGDVRGDDLPAFGNRADNLPNIAVATSAAGDTLVVDGFVVRGGQARLPLRDTGPAVRVFSLGGAVEFRRCTFVENDCGGGAGALGIAGPPTSGSGGVRVVGCRFAHNRSLDAFGGEGGAISCSGTTELRDCSFASNTAPFAGAVQAGPGTVIIDCDFVDNFGAEGGSALRCSTAGASEIRIVNSRFLGNRSNGPGTILVESSARLDVFGCEFCGNFAASGAALCARAASGPTSVTFGSCTAVANRAMANGGAIATQGAGSLAIDNSILYGNTDVGSLAEEAQLALSATTTAIVRTSCIEGLNRFVGSGNTGADPRLIDARGFDQIYGTPDDDLRVAIDSPCLEAGDANRLPIDHDDLDGDGDRTEPLPVSREGTPRVLNQPGIGPPGAPALDIGAHEGPRVPLPGSVPGSTPRFAVSLGVDDRPAPDPAALAPLLFPAEILVPPTAQRVRIRVIAHAVVPGLPIVVAGHFLPTYFEPQLLPQLPALQLGLAQATIYLPTTVNVAGPRLPEDVFAIPPGLAGTTLRLQAFALSATSLAAISDASELYFE